MLPLAEVRSVGLYARAAFESCMSAFGVGRRGADFVCFGRLYPFNIPLNLLVLHTIVY